MGLIAAALEERGIRTICLSTMEAIMGKVRPPRWLALPYPLGFPLGRPREPELQLRIMRRALRLLDEGGPGPVRVEYDPEESG
ncbi:MAG: hypothetical protein ACWGSQ_04630 [Longimicrobiales bacterium]